MIRDSVFAALLIATLPGRVVSAQSPPAASQLAACAAQPACAGILKPIEASEVAALPDSTRLMAALMQSGAALAALRPDYASQIAGAGYCFKTRTPGESTIVAAAATPMQTRLPRLRWCRSDEALPNPPRPGRVLPAPGVAVVGLSLVSFTVTNDSATARLTIGSTVYECREVRQTGIWRPQSCTRLGAG
jgi:hypothetical protein